MHRPVAEKSRRVRKGLHYHGNISTPPDQDQGVSWRLMTAASEIQQAPQLQTIYRAWYNQEGTPLGITDPTDHEIMCCKLHSQSSLASSPPLSTNPAPSSIFPKGELVQCDLRRLAARINAVWVGSTATYNHLWLVPTLRGACSCPAALPLLVSSHGLWMNPPQIISPSLLHWNSF